MAQTSQQKLLTPPCLPGGELGKAAPGVCCVQQWLGFQAPWVFPHTHTHRFTEIPFPHAKRSGLALGWLASPEPCSVSWSGASLCTGGPIQDKVITGEPLRWPEVQTLWGLGLEGQGGFGGIYGFNGCKLALPHHSPAA